MGRTREREVITEMSDINSNAGIPDKKDLETLAAGSEHQIANKTAVITLTVICSILSAAYAAEIFKGARTAGYVIATVILAMAPVAINWILYNRDNESPAILHVTSLGYGLLYTFLLFTAQNDLVFTYAIPMVIVISLYNNKKVTTAVGVVICVENVIDAIIRLTRAENATELTATIEIQVLVMILIVSYLLAVNSGTIKFEQIRRARLLLQESKNNVLMDEILEVSARMSETIDEVSDGMERLSDSVDRTVASMEEVSTGTGESADAVQRQLVKTEEIQNHIGNVEETSRIINDNIGTTNEAVREGKRRIEQMTGYTEQVDRAGKDVAAALDVFKETTSKMNTITDLINDVASETSLLSLNASIEAARAGDAGRGFAVVASEISGLASQTTDATDNIVALINDITSQVGTMVSTIDELIQTGAEESRCAQETAESFNTIADNVEVISDHASRLSGVVSELAAANKEIVESIQTISSITEEVTAHATETHSVSEQNRTIVQDINSMVDSLSVDATELKSKS